jgi:hypothetical protein
METVSIRTGTRMCDKWATDIFFCSYGWSVWFDYIIWSSIYFNVKLVERKLLVEELPGVLVDRCGESE